MQARNSGHLSPIRLFSMFLVHHLGAMGVTEQQLRERLGVEECWLRVTPSGGYLALAPKVIATAVELSGDEQLGLHLGECFHFCLGGAGGLAATHAPTAGMALQTFGRFMSDDRVVQIRRHEERGMTTLHIELHQSWPDAIRWQFLDGFLGSLVTALRAACGVTFTPARVTLTRPAPENPRLHHQVLGGNVEFGGQRDAMTIATAELTKPSMMYEPVLYEQLTFLADLASEQTSGVSPFRQLVEQAIRAGDFTIDAVSTTLGLTPRTLQRRLQSEQISFRRVLLEVRAELAKELLRTTELSIAAVAKRLGYSDDKALRKAVLAITGKTPSQLRSTEEAV